MKVLLVNGSPNKKGCTNRALEEVAKGLVEGGVEAEIFWIRNNLKGGCLGCGNCRKNGKCIFDDSVNEFVALAKQADGFVFGSPVHYASASGNMTSFMDRVFYSASKDTFRLKPAAVITSARRGGTTSAYEQLIKYPGIVEMPIISSCYWNNIHGNTVEEVEQDEEGLQIMRTLGRNMAFYIKCIAAGKESGIVPPEREKDRKVTNFIRQTK